MGDATITPTRLSSHWSLLILYPPAIFRLSYLVDKDYFFK